MGEIKKIKISDLKPHPKNAEIYGCDEDVSDLVDKIKRSGQVHTLVVTSKGIVLAGHRRMRACQKLGITEVNAEICDFDTPEQEIEYIIDNNATREKTNEQKAREASALKESLAVLAKKRKLSTLKQHQSSDAAKTMQQKISSSEVPNLALRENDYETGKVRDIIAPKVGLKSGQEVDRAIKAIKKIDELVEKGQEEDAALLRGVLNNGSISAAENLAKNIEVVKGIPEEDKKAIKSGKKSPNSYIKKADNKQKKRVDVYENAHDTKEVSVHLSADYNTMPRKSYDNVLTNIQNTVVESSKKIRECLEELLSKKYLKSRKRDVTDKTQSKIRSCIETIEAIQELISSMEMDDSDLSTINLREIEN